MIYNILFKKSVSRDLKKIEKYQQIIILDKIENDLPEKAKSCPELSGKYTGFRKYRVGNYRIIFSILDSTLLITKITHGQKAYK